MTAKNLQTKPDQRKNSVFGPEVRGSKWLFLDPAGPFDTCQMEESAQWGLERTQLKGFSPAG